MKATRTLKVQLNEVTVEELAHVAKVWNVPGRARVSILTKQSNTYVINQTTPDLYGGNTSALFTPTEVVFTWEEELDPFEDEVEGPDDERKQW